MDFLKKAFDALTAKKGDLPKVESASDQPQDEQTLVSFVKTRIQDVRNSGSRVANEGIWMTNYSYTMGYSGTYFDTTTRQYRVVPGTASFCGRSRITVNKILPTIQRRQARLCKNAPRFEVRPDDASQEARDRARLEQQIAERDYEFLRLQEKRLLMMTGLQNTGHYFIGVRWNDQLGELLESKNEDGTIDYEYEGDLENELVNPLEMFWDPLATTSDEAQWCIRAKVRKLDYFKSQYPERGQLVKEEDTWLLSVQFEQRIQSMTGSGPIYGATQQNVKNGALEIAYYEKRSKKYPNGRLIVIGSDVLLHDGELPVGEIPFAKFDDVSIAGKFYPEAIVTHLRPIQDQYNRLISKRAEWVNRLVAGKYMAAKGAGLQQEALNSQSGEVLYYNNVPGTSPPTQMNIPVIPQYAYTEEDKLNDQFYDIAGEGEISRGILPAAGIPAIGMQLLLEQDETRIAAMTEQHEHAMAHVMRLNLKYREKFTTNQRLLKIADPNSQYVTKKYSGTDLKSKHDLIVIRGSLAPASKAVKRNDIMNLFGQGLLGDPMDPNVKQKVLSYLEFGDTTAVWQDQALDQAQVKKQIEMIEREQMPEISEFDNHVMHFNELNRYRKSDKFDTLTPLSQAMLLRAIDKHVQFIMKLTAPQFGMAPNAETGVNEATDMNKAQMDESEASQFGAPLDQELPPPETSNLEGEVA